MEGVGVREAVGVLVGLDVSVADRDGLASASRAVARLQAFVDSAKVQIARRGRELAEQGDASAVHALIDEGRCSGNDARVTDGRDRVCEGVPGFEEALAAGVVTGAHLDVVDLHTKGLSDEERADVVAVADELVADAAAQPVGLFDRNVKALVERIRGFHRPDSDVEELERQRRASRVKRWSDRATGMRNTLISLDPVRDASLWTVIDHHLASIRALPGNAERPFAELQVEAVLAAVDAGVTAATGNGSGSGRVPEIVVHVDHRSLCHGRHADSLCETVDGVPVPAATVQRWCCDAIVQAVIVRPDGTVDRLCAEQRTAGRAQRRLLAAMYSHCAHPHCQVPFTACRIHHVVWWTRGGRTVLANLLPLCETHHHLVHEGGWTLTIDPDRHVTWHRPDGTTWHTDTGPNRTPHQTRGRPPDRQPEPPPDPGSGPPPAPPPGRPPRAARSRTPRRARTGTATQPTLL